MEKFHALLLCLDIMNSVSLHSHLFSDRQWVPETGWTPATGITQSNKKHCTSLVLFFCHAMDIVDQGKRMRC